MGKKKPDGRRIIKPEFYIHIWRVNLAKLVRPYLEGPITVKAAVRFDLVKCDLGDGPALYKPHVDLRREPKEGEEFTSEMIKARIALTALEAVDAIGHFDIEASLFHNLIWLGQSFAQLHLEPFAVKGKALVRGGKKGLEIANAKKKERYGRLRAESNKRMDSLVPKSKSERCAAQEVAKCFAHLQVKPSVRTIQEWYLEHKRSHAPH